MRTLVPARRYPGLILGSAIALGATITGASASCPVASGEAAIRYLGPTDRLLSCRFGEDWLGTCEVSTGDACTNSGATRFTGGYLQYCNGSEWMSVDCGTSVGSCTAAEEMSVTATSGEATYCASGTRRPIMPNSICSSLGNVEATLSSPKLTPPATMFGWYDEDSVEIEGDWVFVAARRSNYSHMNSGEVLAYQWNGSGYTLHQRIAGPTSNSNNEFGRGIAADGNRLVVGNLDGAAPSIDTFEWNSGTNSWEHVANNTISGDFRLAEIDIDGNYITVGKYYDDVGGLSFAGRLHIYEWTGSTTGFSDLVLDAPNPTPVSDADYFGLKTSLAGDVAVAGSQYMDVSLSGVMLTNAGAAAVYHNVAGTWTLQQTLQRPSADGGPAAFDGYAYAIDVADTDTDGKGDTIGIGARYVECADGGSNCGAVYVYERQADDTWAYTAKLVGSNVNAHDGFGDSVAVTETGRIVVGNRQDEDAAGPNASGLVYVFEKVSGTWTERSVLKGSALESLDLLGSAVAAEGNRVVATAPFHVSPSTGSPGIAGLARVFTGSPGSWTTSDIIPPAGLDAADEFGGSVDMAAGFLAVGAKRTPSLDSTSRHLPVPQAGAVSIYMRSLSGTWNRVKTIHGDTFDGIFGGAVSITPDTLMVAEPNASVPGGHRNGSVKIYERTIGGDNGWGYSGTIWPEPPQIYSGSGRDNGLSVSGDVLILGAACRRPDGVDRLVENCHGSAFVFEKTASGWTQVKELVPPTRHHTQFFGFSTASSKDEAIVGAIYEDFSGLDRAGAVYIFNRAKGGADNWGLVQRIESPTPTNGARFGEHVALSGDTLVVGERYADVTGENGGAVHIYTRNTADPMQWDHYKTLVPPAGHDQDHAEFGMYVDLSGDVLAVGAPLSDDGGIDSGKVFVFQRNEGGADNWGLTNVITPPAPQPYDHFGVSLAVSGNNIAVGGPHINGLTADSGNDDGGVMVYGCGP